MAGEVAFTTLQVDLGFLLGLEPTSVRLTSDQAERLLNKSRDKLFGILAEAYGDDYFTYCVGVEMIPAAAPGTHRTVPLGRQSASGGEDYWLLANRQAGGITGLPTPNSDDGTMLDAPQFHRLRKVQIPETWTSSDPSEASSEYRPVFTFGGRITDLRRTTLDGLNASQSASAWSTSRPPTYRVIADGQMGSSLYFDPAPSETVCVLVWYVGNPLDLAGSDASTLSPGWADWLVYDSAIQFAIRDRDSSVMLAELRGERDRLEANIRAQARDRDDGQPLRIRETYQRGISEGELRDFVTLKL